MTNELLKTGLSELFGLNKFYWYSTYPLIYKQTNSIIDGTVYYLYSSDDNTYTETTTYYELADSFISGTNYYTLANDTYTLDSTVTESTFSTGTYYTSLVESGLIYYKESYSINAEKWYTDILNYIYTKIYGIDTMKEKVQAFTTLYTYGNDLILQNTYYTLYYDVEGLVEYYKTTDTTPILTNTYYTLNSGVYTAVTSLTELNKNTEYYERTPEPTDKEIFTFIWGSITSSLYTQLILSYPEYFTETTTFCGSCAYGNSDNTNYNTYTSGVFPEDENTTSGTTTTSSNSSTGGCSCLYRKL